MEHLNFSKIKIGDYISMDDSDIKSIEFCLNKLGDNRCCNHCDPLELKFLVEAYDEFYNNLKKREDVNPIILDYYQHRYNGIKAAHCLGDPERKDIRDIRKKIQE